jgi:DNA-binding GntR family transcriptional regulator
MTIQGPDYTSKTDLVAALIRELIITGELATGEQLRQRDLAQRFGVSQTPVREAGRRQRRLRSDISAHHGRGSGKRVIRVRAAARSRSARSGETRCQRS